jgi:hypothetical protein
MSRVLQNYYLNPETPKIKAENIREDRKRAGKVALTVAIITTIVNLFLKFFVG